MCTQFPKKEKSIFRFPLQDLVTQFFGKYCIMTTCRMQMYPTDTHFLICMHQFEWKTIIYSDYISIKYNIALK